MKTKKEIAAVLLFVASLLLSAVSVAVAAPATSVQDAPKDTTTLKGFHCGFNAWKTWYGVNGKFWVWYDDGQNKMQQVMYMMKNETARDLLAGKVVSKELWDYLGWRLTLRLQMFGGVNLCSVTAKVKVY